MYKTITGYACLISGGVVSWSLKKQSLVALSSTKAEYMAATAAMKEAVWLRTLLGEFNLSKTHMITLHIDNQFTILLASNSMFHEHMKHIVIWYHFIQEKLEEGQISTNYIPTNEQIANV
jgi:hypothetical protein